VAGAGPQKSVSVTGQLAGFVDPRAPDFNVWSDQRYDTLGCNKKESGSNGMSELQNGEQQRRAVLRILWDRNGLIR
jgi:hypothetical protein